MNHGLLVWANRSLLKHTTRLVSFELIPMQARTPVISCEWLLSDVFLTRLFTDGKHNKSSSWRSLTTAVGPAIGKFGAQPAK